MSGGLTSARRILPAALTLGALLVVPALASATTRFAAPGGTAADTVCITPDAPKCSVGAAAGGPDVVAADEAVILPGNYSDTAGDLNGDTGNPTDGIVQPNAGNVQGDPGEPMPVITVNGLDPMFPNGLGAFLLSATTLSNVRINAGASATGALTTGFGSSSSVVEHVIATSTHDNAITCNHWNGIVRDSVCLSSGSGSAGIGASVSGGVGTMNLTVRNVTAVSTGTNSFGASYRFFGGSAANWIINTRSTIAKGTGKDVVAGALLFSGTCPNTTVSLDFSDYATTQTQSDACGGVAAVSPAGSGSNQTTAPMLGADGIHELAGSITVDHGFTDGSSGTSDIDGQLRTIGSAADIGADELGHQTSTVVACSPASLGVGASTTCTATVADDSTGPTTPTGKVDFTSGGLGSFGDTSPCALATVSGSEASCQVTFIPAQVGTGTDQITGAYPGDVAHEASEAGFPLGVSQGAGAGPNPLPVKTKCKRKKHKHAAKAKKKKCKKKKKRR